MSASRHAWPRAAAAALLLLAGAACGGGGGGGTDIPTPVISSIDPSSGFSGHDVDVVITGDNFLISPTSSQIVATLDSTTLLSVTRDTADPVHKLHAIVPAGMDAGSKTLRVTNAYGRTGTLANAYTVITSQGAALAVTSLTATPSEVNVGQSVTVVAVVRNAGTATVTGVVAVLPPTMTTPNGGAGSVKDGPTPTTVDSIAPGESATFSWTVEATAAGQVGTDGQKVALALPVTTSGQDAFSQELVQSDPFAGSLIIDEPAGLTATIVAARDTVDVNQAVSVMFSVTNGGTATANLTAMAPSVSLAVAGGGSGSASCTTPSPNPSTGSPVTVGAHGTRTFTWTCSATAAGLLTVSGTATGRDANTGVNLSATPATSDTATVQTPAALHTVIAIQGNPAQINQGQTVTVNLAVSNGGTAPAHVTRVTPTFSPAQPNTSCSAAAPDPPTALAGGGNAQFSWTCTPATVGTLTLGATVAGSDDNTNAALSATASNVSVPVTPAASLVAIPSATPNPVDTGQTVNVTLTVVNGGGAQVDSPAVTAVIDASSTAAGTCTTPSALLGSIVSGGHASSTWTCVATTAGALQLTATVTGTDHNSGATLGVTPTPIAVTVQTPAQVAVLSFSANRTTVDVSPPSPGVAMTLSLRNTGGADARVTITPSASPTGPSCIPVPAAQQVVSGGGGTLTVSWTCTSASANTFNYGATIAAVDANDATRVTNPTVTPVGVQVQTQPALSGSLSVAPSTFHAGQTVTVTLTVNNAGGASASVSNVVLSATAGTGTMTCPTAPSQAFPVVVAGANGSAAFTWTCTGGTVGTVTLGTAVTATDVNEGGSVPATVPNLVVTVQQQLTATLAPLPATIDVGQPLNVALTVSNASGAGSAQVTAVAPSTSTTAITCPAAPTEPLPVTLGSGGSTTFHWACTGAAAGSSTLAASVTATVVGTSLTLSPSVTGLGVTVVRPAAFSPVTLQSPASAMVGQAATVTLSLTNSGGAAASVTAVTPTPTGTPGITCAPASPPAGTSFPVTVSPTGAVAFTWTCTGSATGSYSLGATVTATDANWPAANPSPTVTPNTLSVVPSLSAALAAGATSINVSQSVNLTLTVSNAAGVAAAEVTAVTPSTTTGAVTCPAAPTETLPVTIAGGGSATFHWACTGAANGTAVLGATVVAGTSQTVTSDTATVAVAQSSTPLTGSLSGSPANLPAGTGGTVTLNLTLRNPGSVAARLGANAAVPVPAAGFNCTTPTVPTQDQTIEAGATTPATITWTCTSSGAAAGNYTLDVTVTATDVNGANVSPTIPGYVIPLI